MAKIEHLPITNKDKFERVLYEGGSYRNNRMYHEMRECFMLNDDPEMGGHQFTLHFKYQTHELFIEGIGLEWLGNPFNLDFEEDNYIRYCEDE